MRQQVLTSSLLIALTAQVDAQPILDDPTPCSVVVRAFASKDEAQMHEVSKLMDDVFEKLIRNTQRTVNTAFSANGSALC